ncbi:MAG: hypothetical protein B6I28_03825 [Fusobacteriia bacterium 4572_132]|nr:MAG: hypothetical protein B6I28_03825 [Fusobacteriia bacterium 4572_132]
MKKIVIIIIIISINAMGSILDWEVKETDNFEVFYHEGYEKQADEVIFYMEKYNDKIKRLTGNIEKFKTRVVIQDPGIVSNGYADPMNYKISIFTNNPESSSELTGNNWYNMVGVHELIHINQMTNTSGISKIMTRIFGNFFSANVHLPNWIHEGITVYGESQLNEYDGRLNTGYYDAILNSKVAESKMPSISEAIYNHNSFPMGQYYLYGGTFVRYLAKTYGEEKVSEFFKIHGGNNWSIVGTFIPYVGMDNSAKKVFGKSFPKLFEDWKRYEKENLVKWNLKGEKITKIKYNLSNLIVNNNKLFYVRQNLLVGGPYSYRGLTELCEYIPTEKKSKKLASISSLQGRIQNINNDFYFIEMQDKFGFANVDQGGYGSIGVLCKYNLENSKKSVLFKDEMKTFVMLENGEIIYTKDNKEIFGSEIWKYKNGKKTKIGKINELIGEMKIYNDEIIVVSKSHFGSWNINFFDQKSMQLNPIVNTPRVESRIKVQDDYIYYTANYKKELLTYRYNLKKKTTEKVLTGSYGVDGIKLNDEFYYVGILADGKSIYKTNIETEKIELEQDEIKDENIQINATKKLILKENFKYLLKPNTKIIPSLVSGEDGLGFNSYNLTYEDKEFKLTWNTKLLNPLQLSLNTDFEEVELYGNLPIYKSSRYGLSNISLNCQTDFKEYFPGIRIGFNLARNKIYNFINFDVEEKGYDEYAGYSYLLNKCSISVNGNIFDNFNKELFVRGFGDNENIKTAESGFKLSMDSKFTLFDIKKGLWNPNIFLGDIYGDVFLDYIKSDDYDKIAYGGELQAEMGMGFNISFIPTIGVSYSNEEIKTYFNFGLIMQ